jgi:hypothetical protein
MLRILVAAVVICCAPVSVEAAESFFDGNTALKNCNNVELWCKGFVSGVHDARSDEICGPDNMSVSQLADIFLKMLTNNPERRHLQAASLLLIELDRLYPCP